MPFPNEHSARVRDPGDFQPDSFRRKEIPQSKVVMILGRLKGETTMTVQAYRFPKDTYTPEQAKKWLADNDVKEYTFEPAVKESRQYPEANWQEIIGLDFKEDIVSKENISEAATIKAQIQNLLKQADALLGTKDLPETVVAHVKNMRAALKKTWDELVKSESLREVAKTEDGEEFPASDYAYVPDPDMPSTWKLRLTKTPGGEPDAGIVGAAIAAIGKGFRGQKVEIPSEDLPKVKAKIRAAWKKANPDRDPDEMPPVIKEAEIEAKDMALAGDFMSLVESKPDGKIKVKIIEPGWGASGYYSSEVLERDAGVYKAGTQMFWDHPTLTEEKDRPERSLRDLAGVLTSEGEWMKDGKAGAGVYADCEVFEDYRPVIAEIAPHIGISHRALGKAKNGEAEGKKGTIIEKITAAQSVDFVTQPGAGGRILELFESVRGLKERKIREKEELDMAIDQEKLAQMEKTIKEANERADGLDAENKRLTESLLLIEAGRFVATELAAVANLPDITKERLQGSLSKALVVKDGKIDEEAYRAKIKETIQAEVDYLAKVTGSGKVKGMGPKGDNQSTGSLKDAFKGLFFDKPNEEAERLAQIAVEGR